VSGYVSGATLRSGFSSYLCESFLIDNILGLSYYECTQKEEVDMSDFGKHHTSNKIFWGLVLIVLGGLILLRNFGYLEYDIVRFWPVLLILWGIKKLIY
jgi:hypothetical protein